MSFQEDDCRHQRETSNREKSVAEKILSARGNSRPCIYWSHHLASQNMRMTQSNESLYPWTGTASLGPCVWSTALSAEQKSVSQKNKQYPAIPESHTEETSCLPSNHSSHLNINDQYQGRYYTILMYFNCWLKNLRAARMRFMKGKPWTNFRQHVTTLNCPFPPLVQFTKDDLQQGPRAFCLMCSNSEKSVSSVLFVARNHKYFTDWSPVTLVSLKCITPQNHRITE